MTRINSNSACHPIVSVLAHTLNDPQRATEAAMILSVLKSFNQTTYCKDGCEAIRKLFREIALKVHPDKCRTEKKAIDAFVTAVDAKNTLCKASAIRELCDSGRPKYPEDDVQYSRYANSVNAWSETLLNQRTVREKAKSGDRIAMETLKEMAKSDLKALETLESIWQDGIFYTSEEEKSSIRKKFREALEKAESENLRGSTVDALRMREMKVNTTQPIVKQLKGPEGKVR
jgi:DnaJ domain